MRRNEGGDIYKESRRDSQRKNEVRNFVIFTQNSPASLKYCGLTHLRNALFNESEVLRADVNIVPDEEEVLEDGEEKTFGGSLAN